MPIDIHQARDIAQRWGKVADSQPLLDFAKTGLIADRDRLAEAINGIRIFLKDPVELDQLLVFIQTPCRYEAAAREHGWAVDDETIYHIHDYDRAVGYKSWEDCCESEDIVVADEPTAVPQNRRRH